VRVVTVGKLGGMHRHAHPSRLLPPLFATVLLAIGGPLPAQAQDAATKPGWAANCISAARAAEPDCEVMQRAVLSGSGQLVASVTVRVPADTRRPVMMIRLPLGLSLEGGVTIDVDGAGAHSLPLQTCDQSGCYAGAPLPADLAAAMTAGKSLDLVFSGLDKTPVRVALPLAGFASAFDAIK